MDTVFAYMFHRTAATVYLIYAGWGLIVGVDGVPSLVYQQGNEWTTLFALAVFATAVPACLGATFFPKYARLELFAGASFAALLLVYFFFLLLNLTQGIGSVAGFEILLSVVVIPIARTFIVMFFLIQQAKERQAGLRGD